MSDLRSGARVIINGADSWSIGQIEEFRPPGALPQIAGAPAANLVREILAEWGVKRVAMISHHGVIFAALELEDGWFDLRRQPLQIEPFDLAGLIRHRVQ